jgi:DNA polymerase-3 subunit delta'
MTDLLLHPTTRDQAAHFVKNPSHALLLTGASGSGKSTLALALAAQLLDLPEARNSPAVRHIQPINASISIEAVRQLRLFVKLRSPYRHKTTNRIVLIEDAHYLADEAQNALLKLLEEPPSGFVVFLTATSQQALLPTIQSRVARLAVLAPQASDSASFFATRKYDASAIRRST